MLTCIIKDNGEENVIKLTYENIYRELKSIPGAELTVSETWLGALNRVENRYVVFLESDCLVSGGYFDSMLGLLQKSPHFRKIAMMTSSTGVNNWANRFYGYSGDQVWSNKAHLDDGTELQTKNNYIKPNKEKKSTGVYPVQVGYVPGSLLHMGMLTKALSTLNAQEGIENNLAQMSILLSLTFWGQGGAKEGSDSFGGGIGNRVHINPNSTYVTTEEYVNDLQPGDKRMDKLMAMFKAQSI